MHSNIDPLIFQLDYQRQQLILERQSFHLDQLRVLEMRARHEAQSKLVTAGWLKR